MATNLGTLHWLGFNGAPFIQQATISTPSWSLALTYAGSHNLTAAEPRYTRTDPDDSPIVQVWTSYLTMTAPSRISQLQLQLLPDTQHSEYHDTQEIANMSCINQTERSSLDKPWLPLGKDGFSNESRATATCYCGSVQLEFVSVNATTCYNATMLTFYCVWWQTASRGRGHGRLIHLQLHRLPQNHGLDVCVQPHHPRPGYQARPRPGQAH